MLVRLSELRGYRIRATDGSLGSVTDEYFDDSTWTLRYIVVDTGSWLSGRKVLLAPAVLGEPDLARQEWPVSLTQDQVRNSPDVHTERPVSIGHERALARHYGWPTYWSPAAVATSPPPFAEPIGTPGRVSDTLANADVLARERDQGVEIDPHLRSAREVMGYQLAARDGAFGQIDDIIIDTRNWAFRYLIADTGSWLPGRRVVLSPLWVTGLDWRNKQIAFELSRDEIKGSPEYDPEMRLDRSYEDRLHRHYGREPYWERG